MDQNNFLTLNTHEAAKKVLALKSEIIGCFVERTTNEIESSKETPRPALIDNLPLFIDNLADALHKGLRDYVAEEASVLGVMHGRERASLNQYNLNDLLAEYRILDEIIQEKLHEKNALLNRESQKIIHDAIHKGLANSSEEFSRLRSQLEIQHARERESLLKATKAAHQELEDFFMQAPVPMCILTGKNHKFTLANPAYENLFHKSFVGKTVAEAFRPEDVQDFIPLLDQVYETGKPFIGKEVRFDLPDKEGKIISHWLDFGYHPSRDADGKIKGILAIVVDVTEQVTSRAKIWESEQRFKIISEESPQIIWTANPQGEITFLSQYWYELTGLSLEDTADRGWKDVLAKEDVERVGAIFEHSFKTGEDYYAEQRYLRKRDGKYVWFASQAKAVRDEEGKITQWIGVAYDIDTQKRMVAQLEEESYLRERFISTLSHDLRTPITAAKMSAQLIAKKLTDPTLQKISFRISDLMDRADGMIRDLLDANLIKAGEKIPLKKEEMNLNQLVTEVLDELASIHGDRFRFSEKNEIQGYWDRNALRRILENLCSNAVKYGFPGTEIIVTLFQESEQAIIEVFNEGPYIPASDQQSLFELFKRAGSVKDGGVRGWGVGLTLVKGLTEAHGGMVDVSSIENKGTTFSVKLPMASQSRSDPTHPF